MAEIKVPSMGESITEATVGTILKPTGSHVEMDDEILELETDKVNQVLYAPQAGVITLKVKSEDVVKIGDVIGTIASGEAPSKTPAKEEKQGAENKPVEGSIRVSRQEFFKTNEPIKKEEKKEPPKTPKKEERGETRQKMSRIRQVIAKRLVEAQANAAMLTTFNEIDMTSVIGLRTKYKEEFQKKHGTKLGFMSFFVKACVSALKQLPGLNSYVDGDEIVHRDYYDIGIAVGTEKGLFVPVLRDCDRLSFAGVEKAIAHFAQEARAGTIKADDLQGGGFTITNGGVYGSLLSTPILNPPQSGILGMHKIDKRAVVVDDQIVIREMMYVALSYDHRIVDGKEAVTFLVLMKELLEDPARLELGV